MLGIYCVYRYSSIEIYTVLEVITRFAYNTLYCMQFICKGSVLAKIKKTKMGIQWNVWVLLTFELKVAKNLMNGWNSSAASSYSIKSAK